MTEIDQQFVEFIVKSLVGNPDDVAIERTIDEKGVLLKLTVNGEDLGRVIGKRGATAQSIRTLLRALGTKYDARYNLKIIDPEGDNRPPRTSSDDNSQAPSRVSDDSTAKPAVSDEPAEEPVAQDQEPVVEEVQEEVSIADKHRADLDDLDDLDI